MTEEFFNRDLSWLEFNARILKEGLREDIPVMERLKFMAIVSTNFDEFFQVRVASIKRQEIENPHEKDISGRTPSEILKAISERTHGITRVQYDCMARELLPRLAEAGLVYLDAAHYSESQRAYTQNLFQREIFPLLTPLRLEEGNFPHIGNQFVHAAFKLEPIPGIKRNFSLFEPENSRATPDNTSTASSATPAAITAAIVQIPTSLSRIVFLPANDEKRHFTLLDDIICEYGTQLFPGYNVAESMLFSIARDSDFAVDEGSSHFIQAMREVLVKRQSSVAVRMVCNSKSPLLMQILAKELNLSGQDIYEVNGPIHPEAMAELADTSEGRAISFAEWKHLEPTYLDEDKSIWEVLRRQDILLSLPYESFSTVTRFISDAADDSGTLAIKMTLYRTERDSAIVAALERAARRGIQVTAFVELKARFDEQRNIEWATRLEKAGVIVVYGIVNLKVHGKAALVVRREADTIRRYVHLSTGNYNANTAKIYSDFSFFTAKEEIASDITQFFNVLSGYSTLQTMKHVSMAPVTLKSNLISMIEREAKVSTKENPGLIIAKMNSLGHEEVIRALYKASCAGVRILLNVRGICQLVPGVKGMSENITVNSIVGRYLEHSRVFFFQNGGQEELYLSSADWMPRNLDRRVELMFPVTDKAVRETIKEALKIYFTDNSHSHILQSDGSWRESEREEDEPAICAQEILYEKFKRRSEAAKKETKIEFKVRRRN